VNNITPETIKSEITDVLASIYEQDYYTVPVSSEPELTGDNHIDIPEVERLMKKAAKQLDFEQAAKLRDILFKLKNERN
jgi:excinuclease ABC subunit B